MKVTQLDGITLIESNEGLYITTVIPSELKATKLYLGINDSIENYKEVEEVLNILPTEEDFNEETTELLGVSLKEAYFNLAKENQELKEENQTQSELIDITMMATDEMFSLIEPMLSNLKSATRKGVTPMVEMYVAMVQRGLKTIDEVPARYRAEVERILKQLEA